jgi:hypothetical protein
MTVSRFMETALSMAKPEWTMGQVGDIADMFRRFYNIGVDESAAIAESWANECDPGGQSMEGYSNLAQTIRKLNKP